MTKLVQFLITLSLACGVWASFLLRFDKSSVYYQYVVIPLPLWSLICFGIYSASVVLYRTLTFNDCPEAAKELLEQIDEARADLKKKGMKSL